jgi:2-haloacid dehalogenase
VTSAYVFDAYGTLLDFDSAVGRCDRDRALPAGFSQLWRAKQLEYAWALQAMGAYRDFESLTAEALDYTIGATGAGGPLRGALLDSFLSLDPFPEADGVLEALRQAGNRLAVLSNGTAGMLDSALSAARIDRHFDSVISVDEIGVYKPDRRVYEHAASRLGVAVSTVRFVSANAWDAAGAHRFGFEAIRVNRNGAPDEYDLARSAATVPDLGGLLGAAPPPTDAGGGT